jgi:integrase
LISKPEPFGSAPGKTKNREGRTVYLDNNLKEMFRGLFTNRRLDIPFVFTRNGEQIKGFRKAWKTACKQAGLEGRIYHDFRRTAVRDLVRSGVPERVAMKITGHKTRSVFERYNIPCDRDLIEAAERRSQHYQEQKELCNQSFRHGCGNQ